MYVYARNSLHLRFQAFLLKKIYLKLINFFFDVGLQNI